MTTFLSRDTIASLTAEAAAGDARFGKPEHGWRRSLFSVIFESESRAGRLFDLVLIAVIVTSVAVVILDSVQAIHLRWGSVFGVLEWCFTALFTLEYLGRLACVKRPLRYALSFYGVIDLLALLPTFLAVLTPELAYLIDVRILRLLRVFRIFKLSRYSAEYRALVSAVAASRRKIIVFVGFVMLVVLVMGTLMYVVEGPQHGFTSIPVAVYWAISTMATVGFGDLVPKTDLGRAIASVMMLLGWGVLAVPTGIVTAEMARRPYDDEGTAAALPLAPRGVLAMTALAPDEAAAPAVPRKRLTPAARRRALGQHRRGAR
ncbi:ion transporter [Variovorax paradoxus]|jgi:voltage-gated potassium channel|uniref:ion transporter n=1 Tax=Variovorax TaxID=34072 RepID=UPI0006E59F10|nr:MULTISPECIES: ion transporter [unclassified Variovorax]KPU90666.1 ion transporter [Variovorax paradoxus]KPU91464.1 ion transporter [Variovorax paradoxus]KPU98745.1 ion transporter [Variovorax paradoxus]KPV13240.1 ion transporter [Variovorax paradoxus]KPV18897.1 ion transporter [Variovorax paradoxus]